VKTAKLSQAMVACSSYLFNIEVVVKKIVIFGNSGSGKTTLAKRLAAQYQLAHFDLDSIAWLQGQPPTRAPIKDSFRQVDSFCEVHKAWVIEGCYAELIEHACAQADEMIFMNLPVVRCIDNARQRPWEPHKYASKQAQDANLPMLISWISDYENRDDSFSKQAHVALFENFERKKTMRVSND
jgi:adenylate kinase family enzyme